MNAAIWVTFARGLTHGTATIKVLIVARMLDPEAWGVFAIAMLTLSILNMLTEQGISQALIQRSGDIEAFLATAWCTSVLRGLAIFAISWLVAPYIASGMGSPAALWPIRVIGLSFLIKGFSSLAATVLVRDLRYNRLTTISFAETLFDLVTTCALAYAGWGVWALIAGQIGAATGFLLASYAVFPRFHGFSFSWTLYRELRSYGIWIMSSNLLSTTLIKGTEIAVGFLLPAAALGRYQVASMISVTPTLEFSKIVGTVSFPAFSRLANEPERATQPFIWILFFTTALVLLPAQILWVASAPLTELLLGRQWSGAAVLLPGFAVWAASRATATSYGSLFNAFGRPSLNARFQLAMVIALAIAAYPALTAYGELGLSVLLASLGLFGQFLRTPAVITLLKCPAGNFIRYLIAPWAAAAAAATITTGLTSNSTIAHPAITLAIRSSVCLASYLLCLIVVSRLLNIPFRAILHYCSLPFVQRLQGLLRRVSHTPKHAHAP